MADDLTVEVRRSPRRRRTVTAYQRDGKVIVLIPATFTTQQEHEWVRRMRDRVQRRAGRRAESDTELSRRARSLSEQYLGGAARPVSVRWVDNQERRWGSATPALGTIRLSSRLRSMPAWVVDYVLLHELAHLVHPGHGPAFWSLLAGYPKLERARGYLEGVSAAAQLGWTDEQDCD